MSAIDFLNVSDKRLRRVLFDARAENSNLASKSDSAQFILHCDRMKIHTQLATQANFQKIKPFSLS